MNLNTVMDELHEAIELHWVAPQGGWKYACEWRCYRCPSAWVRHQWNRGEYAPRAMADLRRKAREHREMYHGAAA